MFPGIPDDVFLEELVPQLSMRECVMLSGLSHELNQNLPNMLKLVPQEFEPKIPGESSCDIGKGLNHSVPEDPAINSISCVNDHYYSYHANVYDLPQASTLKYFTIANPDNRDVETIATVFPNLKYLKLESLVIYQNTPVNVIIADISKLKNLRTLIINVETENHVWNFSQLSLDYFQFMTCNFEIISSGNIDYAHTNTTLTLPNSRIYDLDIDFDQSVCDQILAVEPQPVYVHMNFLDYDDNQSKIDKFKKKLDEKNIINKITYEWDF